MNECLICKKHITQQGKCMSNKSNCLLFEEEVRGKMIRGTFKFQISQTAATPIIKNGSVLKYIEKGKEYECIVIKINWINMQTGVMSVDATYHEYEKPRFEAKKLFAVLN